MRTFGPSLALLLALTATAGAAVDLTLVRRPTVDAKPFDSKAAYGPCTGPVAQRAPDDSLDMSTGFDCFDFRSHTSNGAITPEQKRWRATLTATMRAHGFRNYFREWWHYSFGGPATHYDFPITPR